MANALGNDAVLCPDGQWRYGGIGEPIGWVVRPAIVVVHSDGREERLSECEVLKNNVIYAQPPR